MASPPIIRAFFDEATNTVSYVVADPTTKKAAIIDPVLDYDHECRDRGHAICRGDAESR
jgi:glyoxylase-like metal-dependent hydrolase (beta-lactamase superfamily II)